MGTPGIDERRVSQFLREEVPGVRGPFRFDLIAGGRSNLTYRVHDEGDGDRTFVLRRPPLGHVLPTAHDMAREHRVLSALADTEVPVPRPLALCRDPEVNDQVFYVMEDRPGFPSRRELIDAYARASGRTVESVDYYRVLALTKLAVISEGIYKRWQMGKTLGTGFASLDRRAPAMAARALAIADGAADPRLRGAR